MEGYQFKPQCRKKLQGGGCANVQGPELPNGGPVMNRYPALAHMQHPPSNPERENAVKKEKQVRSENNCYPVHHLLQML